MAQCGKERMKRIQVVLTLLAMLVLASGGIYARADAALLMEEPYGMFGAINPTGHAAIYLNHVCAESPIELRACRPGEPGVVISRYHRIAGYDWIAIPLVPYLYAVERVEDVPSTVDSAQVAQLRDAYRREHLIGLIPDIAEGEKAGEAPKGDWPQLIGASYDRKIYGFQIETTPEADERFIAEYNDRRNESRFNLFYRNCADFSRTLLNLYYPHSIRRNFFVDLGITTPKQVARSLTKYAKRNPDLDFSTFVIPQIPGQHRSQPSRRWRGGGDVEVEKICCAAGRVESAAYRGHGCRLSGGRPLYASEGRAEGVGAGQYSGQRSRGGPRSECDECRCECNDRRCERNDRSSECNDGIDAACPGPGRRCATASPWSGRPFYSAFRRRGGSIIGLHAATRLS